LEPNTAEQGPYRINGRADVRIPNRQSKKHFSRAGVTCSNGARPTLWEQWDTVIMFTRITIPCSARSVKWFYKGASPAITQPRCHRPSTRIIIKKSRRSVIFVGPSVLQFPHFHGPITTGWDRYAPAFGSRCEKHRWCHALVWLARKKEAGPLHHGRAERPSPGPKWSGIYDETNKLSGDGRVSPGNMNLVSQLQ